MSGRGRSGCDTQRGGVERVEQVPSAEMVEFTDRVKHQALAFDAVRQSSSVVVGGHGAIIRIAYGYGRVSFATCASTSISTFQLGSSNPATTTIVAAGEAAPNTCWCARPMSS